jgi:hypothetical protein
MSAVRLTAGFISVLVPVGLMGYFVLVPQVWPHGVSFFDYALPILGGLGLLTVLAFVSYALRSNAVPREKRALWVVVLLFANIYALPFFWYWYVRDHHPNP